MHHRIAPEKLWHEIRLSALSISSRWAFIALAALVIALFCRLGFWQLDRAHQKEQLLARQMERSQLPVMDLESLIHHTTDFADYPLSMRGRYLNEKSFLLDNRIYQGQVGFNVITPFISEGVAVLVDRGWMPQQHATRALPEIPPRHGLLRVFGTVYEPSQVFLLRNDDYSNPQWPMLLQKIDIEKIAGLLESPVAPFILRLAADSKGAFTRDLPLANVSPDKNYGYAFQWFSFAVAVFCLTLILNFKRYFKARS